MLQVLRRGQRWVMALVVVAVGGGMVFFLAVGGGWGRQAQPHIAVTVGDRQFDWRDFERVRQRHADEFRRALGDAFDAEQAADYLDQSAAGSLVQMAILAEEGERLGLRVAPEEMREYLRGVPGGTGADGRIDRDAWTQHAEREYGSVSRFEAALRDDLLARKASRLLDEAFALSDAELRELLRYRTERVQVACVSVDPVALRKDQEAGDAEVDAFLASDAPRVQALYDERKDEFDQPEQVRARHVLIPLAKGEGVDPAKAEADALAQAQRVAARLRAGETFEKLAREFPGDPGSADKGGDLGFFPRGRMVAPFEEAAFSLEPGVVSEPVKSSYGFHVIRVDEKRPAKVIPFDEAKKSLARELVIERKAQQAAAELVEKLLEAVRQGKMLVDAARERGLPIQRPEPLARRGDGVIPGLGTSKPALAAVFALTDANPTLGRAFELDGKQVLFQRLGGSRASDAEIDALLASQRDEMIRQRRGELLSAWIDARRDELEKNGALVYNLGRRSADAE
jgi:peptidyl-prolyl cis-trans isomerase D